MNAPKNFMHIDEEVIRVKIGNNTCEYLIDIDGGESIISDDTNEHGVFVIPKTDSHLNVLYFRIVWSAWVNKDYDVSIHIVPIGRGKQSIDSYLQRISLKDVESKYAFMDWIKLLCEREDSNLRTLTKSSF